MPMHFVKADPVKEIDKEFYNLALAEELNRIISLSGLKYEDFYQGGKITFDGRIFKYIASNSSEVRDCLSKVNTQLRETDGFKDLPWSGPLTPLEWIGWFFVTREAVGAKKPLSDEFSTAFVALLMQKLEENNLIEKNILKQSQKQRWVESLFNSYKIAVNFDRLGLFLSAISERFFGNILKVLNERIYDLGPLETDERIEILEALITKIRDSDPDTKARVLSYRKYTNSLLFNEQLRQVGAILWSSNPSEELSPRKAAERLDQLYFPIAGQAKAESVKEEEQNQKGAAILLSGGVYTSKVDNSKIDTFVEIIENEIQLELVLGHSSNPLDILDKIKSSQNKILLVLATTYGLLINLDDNEKKVFIARLINHRRERYNNLKTVARLGIATTVNMMTLDPSLKEIFKMVFYKPLDFNKSEDVNKFMEELKKVYNAMSNNVEETAERKARPFSS